MKVSKAVRVGLSGTSLALAALASVGCGKEEVATKEQLKARAHYVEQAVDQAAAVQEREARRDHEDARRDAIATGDQETDGQASPWFLRPGGSERNPGADRPVSPVSTETNNQSSETPPAIVIHEPPKPVKPVAVPPQPKRPPGWQIRAACGRG